MDSERQVDSLDVASSVASAATLRALQLPETLTLIGGFAGTDAGRAKVSELRPLDSPHRLEARRAAVAELSSMIAAGGRVLAVLDGEMQELVGFLRSERGIDAVVVWELASCLGVWLAAEHRIVTAESPQLRARITDRLDAWDAETRAGREEFARTALRQLDERGEVRDDASDELSRLRKVVGTRRNAAYSSAERFVDAHRDELAEDTVGFRDGRLSLLLPSGRKGRLPGMIHGRSSTGKSFVFEPLELVESNNALRTALGDEQAERARIVRELISYVEQSRALLASTLELMVEVDALQAISLFAGQAEAIAPQLTREPGLVLNAARHPLLDARLLHARRRTLRTDEPERELVPLTVELDDKHRVLVVTGPNAGGKTVALKTIGLMSALAQTGVPVPCAEGTTLPFFDAIVAVVGDEQDLLGDQSTFSAKLNRLKEVHERASTASLILIDELGSGTGPEEGAAISIAVLEGLLATRCLAVFTTHLTEVAAAALDAEPALCAAMDFDSETLGPTFELRMGPPGGSEALSLARRVGLPAPWLDRAENLLGDEHRTLRGLLREVEALRDDLAERAQELERQRAEHESLLEATKRESEALADERVRSQRGLKDAVAKLQAEVRKTLDEEVERLRKSGKAAKGERARAGTKVTEALSGSTRAAVAELGLEEEPTERPSVGDRVRHSMLGWTGQLEELKGERATVNVRGKRLTSSVHQLQRLGAQETPKRKVTIRAPQRPDVGLELNLVGERVAEALERLDGYIDQAILGGADEVRIVHGHGTGRLRNAVRDHLRRHPMVTKTQSAPQNLGGDGATLARIGTAQDGPGERARVGR